jgi:hypothetical protein
MLNITVEKFPESFVTISPMSIKRDWMDNTPEKHAYRCFPVTSANMVGWNISCDKDIRFIWDGINDTSQDHVKILEGGDFTYTGRGQSSVSIHTGLIFRTDENTSLLTINPVNYFNDNFETIATVISTSWLDSGFPLAIKSKVPNKEILIKSGEPIATIIPISLSAMDKTEIEIFNYSDPGRIRENKNKSYGIASQKINSAGRWTNWYRNATNENEEKIGSHEVTTLKLSVKDNRENGIII